MPISIHHSRQAASLANYVHFRPPASVRRQSRWISVVNFEDLPLGEAQEITSRTW